MEDETVANLVETARVAVNLVTALSLASKVKPISLGTGPEALMAYYHLGELCGMLRNLGILNLKDIEFKYTAGEK